MNKLGYITGDGYTLTYQIGNALPSASLSSSGRLEANALLSARKIGRYSYWPDGPEDNERMLCSMLIKGNRLLPSTIEKQIAILYGTGPRLFREEIKDDGLLSRHYIHDTEIQNWLESWVENGLNNTYKEYLIKAIRSYYYSEGIYSKWHLSKGLSVGIKTVPVVGLEHISELRCRFATTKALSNKSDVEDKDFDLVGIGNWAKTASSNEILFYPRFNFNTPLKAPGAISYSKNANYDTDIYATNVFFAGIKSWISGCNATPDYINSFLENALSARHHVIIPNAWYNAKEKALMELCEINQERRAKGEELVTIKVGDKTLEIGEEYSSELLEKYINMELENLTNFLAGRGKNQGKTYATRSFMNEQGGIEKWEIAEIPQKYKEYIEALIAYDKRADNVILSAKGIDPSISNVTPDGSISKSGADTFYNYIIYLTQQSIPEEVVCRDINFALKLNFPKQYAEGVRIGFYRPIVQRQEDVTPSARMKNQQE